MVIFNSYVKLPEGIPSTFWRLLDVQPIRGKGIFPFLSVRLCLTTQLNESKVTMNFHGSTYPYPSEIHLTLQE